MTGAGRQQGVLLRNHEVVFTGGEHRAKILKRTLYVAQNQIDLTRQGEQRRIMVVRDEVCPNQPSGVFGATDRDQTLRFRRQIADLRVIQTAGRSIVGDRKVILLHPFGHQAADVPHMRVGLLEFGGFFDRATRRLELTLFETGLSEKDMSLHVGWIPAERFFEETDRLVHLAAIKLLLGKLVPYFVLGLGSFMLSVFVAVGFFDVPFRGSMIALSLAAALFMLCSLGQGLLISTLTRNQLVAAQVAVMLAFLPAFYFSNFVFELDSMPLALQLFSYAIPARFLVSTLQTQFLAGNVWSVLLPDLAALATFAVVIFTICAFFTRTRLD